MTDDTPPTDSVLPSPFRALLVDDSEFDGTLLQRALAKALGDAELRQCWDPEEAQRVLAEQAFDLVFLDHHLGSMSGLELLAQLRSGGFEGPVVLYTGQPQGHSDARLEELGCRAVLDKGDASPATVLAAIRSAWTASVQTDSQ